MSEQPVTPPAWQPPPARPPLTTRHKSGARLAGILGFLLLSLGFGVFGLPLALLAVGALFALVVGIIGRTAGGAEGLRQFMEGIAPFDPQALILPLLLVSILGMAIMAGALLLSAGILRRYEVARPWAVTWAGAGVGIVGSWVLSGVTSFSFSLTGSFGDRQDFAAVGIIAGVIAFLVGVAGTAVIGWLSWWWMAHALRQPATAVAVP